MLSRLGYNVAQFNDCKEAHLELQQDIKEAKAELKDVIEKANKDIAAKKH